MSWSSKDWDRFYDAMLEDGLEEFKDWLEQEPRDLEVFEHGMTPLHWAAYYDNPEMIDVLLDAGADINVLDENDMTPVKVAARGNKLEALKHLVLRGADTSGLGEQAHTARTKEAIKQAKKEPLEAVGQVMVRKGMPYQAIGKKVSEYAGVGKGKRRSRLNKKTRRSKRKRGHTKRC